MAETPTPQTIPGPPLSATSDTPDIPTTPPPLSASGMTGGDNPPEPEVPPVEEPPAETPPVETPPAEAPPAEQPPAETPPAEGEAKPREDKGVGKVLNAKDAEIARLQAEKDALQRQFNEAVLKREPPAPVQPQVEVKPDLRPARPKLSDFETPQAHEAALDKYDDDFAAWTVRQAEARAKATVDADRAVDRGLANQQQQTQQWETALTRHNERVTKITETIPDFAAVALADDHPVTPSMVSVILQSERSAEILYELGKNHAESQAIAAMVVPGQVFPPGHPMAGQPVPDLARQAAALGRIEGRIEARAAAAPPAATPSKQVSKAPPPVKPVGSRANAAPKTGDEKSAEEYFNDHPLTRRRAEAAAKLGITTH
jgi:hypothetical protein